VIASDSGLCGTYNNNILTAAKKFLDSNKDREIDVIAVGHEVSKFMKKRNIRVTREYSNLYGKYDPKVSDELTRLFIYKFTSGASAEIYIGYTRFSSSLRHVPTVEKFLPIPKPEGGNDLSYLVEPDRQTLLNDLISKYLMHKIRAVMLEAFTSEHSARMFAMKNATDNADDLINRLTLQRNKARQTAITQEITEIAMSAEALKG